MPRFPWFLFFVLCCQPALHQYGQEEADVWKRGKQAWVRTYLATESVEDAREFATLRIYPLNTPEINIEGRLQYLKVRMLNLFLDVPPPDR